MGPGVVDGRRDDSSVITSANGVRQSGITSWFGATRSIVTSGAGASRASASGDRSTSGEWSRSTRRLIWWSRGEDASGVVVVFVVVGVPRGLGDDLSLGNDGQSRNDSDGQLAVHLCSIDCG